MKRYKLLTLLLVLVVTMTFVLTACNSAVPPTTAIRWEDGETLTYNITLLSDVESELSKEYEGVTFLRNAQLTNDQTDQLKPISVKGTLTTTIKFDGDNVVYTVSQRLEETHKLSNPTVKELVNKIDKSMILEQTDTNVTLLSTTETRTVFKKDSAQTPISSYKKINGYYVGKIASEVTNIEVTANYEGTTAKVKLIQNGTTTENEYKVGATTFIDATQILLYVRSYDQTANFQTTATFYVYDPITNQTALMGTALQREYNIQLNIGELPYATVNAMGIATDSGAAIGYVYNNPKDTMISNVSTTGLNKFTTVKFQSGHYVYELANYTEEQVEQLKYVKPTSDK